MALYQFAAQAVAKLGLPSTRPPSTSTSVSVSGGEEDGTESSPSSVGLRSALYSLPMPSSLRAAVTALATEASKHSVILRSAIDSSNIWVLAKEALSSATAAKPTNTESKVGGDNGSNGNAMGRKGKGKDDKKKNGSGVPLVTISNDDTLNMSWLLVLIYESTMGKGGLKGSHPFISLVRHHRVTLKTAVDAARTLARVTHGDRPASLMDHSSSSSYNGNDEKPVMPRYVRVNTLLASLQQALTHFSSTEKYNRLDDTICNQILSRELPLLPTMAPKQRAIGVDSVIPSLLFLPPSTSLHGKHPHRLQSHDWLFDDVVDVIGHGWVNHGRLILQDRASCLSAVAMLPLPR
jgi:hypothetical protein